MAPDRTEQARPRIVVTGIGSVSAIAAGTGSLVAAALARGHSGIGPVQGFPTDGYASRLGAEAADVGAHLQDGEARRLSRASQLAVVAARFALTDAGLSPDPQPPIGLVLGSHWGDFRSSVSFVRGFLERGILGLSPLVFPNTVLNAVAAQVSIAAGVRGPMLTLSELDVAGELAVARGAALIAAGRASVVLAGGWDELSPVLYRELCRLGTVSSREPGPEGCWPFDRRANGTVLGEGATFLVLEAADAARARGARVYAELVGAASGNLPGAAHGFPPPRRREPAVVRRALAAAGVAAAEVEVAYLTGAGHPAHDACELDLVTRALGPAPTRLTALTPLVGEHAGLSGLRAAAAALAVAGADVPALPDLADPIRPDLRLVTGTYAGRSPDPPATALVHGLARGGSHVALVFRAADGDRRRAA